ncbi:Glycosyl transferases group 1 [Halodesulfovibrio marinisediminis DSM 17456]|uniref:Glycosyl transferases group 1 n=2 Tax=Halodesulfovibrio marinisediminis TaxID=458711 RepID=A0A1N6E078_9BACT|nr:Glycosyl transferases group 1 [Halodesulfovibrio marinisediminis DSM 17456]
MNNTQQHILIVPPLDKSEACIVTGCKESLEKLGHKVSVFNTEAWVPVCSALQNLPVTLAHQDALGSQGMELISGAVVAVVESQHIDIVLGFPQSPLTSSSREKMQARGIVTVCWMTEEYASFPYWRKAIECCDVVATIQHEPFISELSVLGHVPVYLPFAAKSACCTPVVTHTAAEGMIAVLGDASDEMANALSSHTGRGMVLWGDGWEKYEQLVPYYQGKLQSLTRSERKALYRDAAIIVNIHSTDVGTGDSVNMETFAIASCGGFQLVDKRTLMEGMFSYDELVMFESAEELSELLTEFIDDRNARLEYARNAQKLVLAKHTYEQRMESLLQAIAEAIK